MFVRTVNGYMYYPGTSLNSTSGVAGISSGTSGCAPAGVAAALSAAGNVTALRSMASVTNNGALTPHQPTTPGLNGIGHQLNGSTLPHVTVGAAAGVTNGAGLSSLNGALTGYTTTPAPAGLNGISGLTPAGLNAGGLTPGSSTTAAAALLGVAGTKWMLPDWTSALALRFPLVRTFSF